jgi:endonuclease/exonuclease/phosphatase family metal-dependent hydrolase
VRFLSSIVALIACVTVAAAQNPATPDLASLGRPSQPHVRIMTWNIATNSIFADPGIRRAADLDGGRPAQFARIMRALRPDVVCLQEVFPPRTAEDVGPLLDSIAPLGGNHRWRAWGVRDVVIATSGSLSMRAARVEDWGSRVTRAHAMALVTFPAERGVPSLYVVGAHMQSQSQPSDIAARQRHADAIVQWLRELRAPTASGGLSPGTPFVVLGDFNAYHTDPARHLQTLITGAIADTVRFGRGFAPDWDGTALADAAPLHNRVGPATYTFGDGAGPPPPAALDRILYTDSRLTLLGAFVLDTMTLDPATLSRLGLHRTDVLLNATAGRYDHLPVVADFAARQN